MLEHNHWKNYFPTFASHAYPNLCYLDSAATCLTPKPVADAIYHYQCYAHANSHRGFYQLSAKATEKVEYAKQRVAEFVGAMSAENIVFVNSTTEAINLVAFSYVAYQLENLSDAINTNIVISASEHHANLLPWQRLCEQFGCELRIVQLNSSGSICLTDLKSKLDSSTVLLAINHYSNVLGTENPIKEITSIAANSNAKVLIDGAQAVSHGPVDVIDLNCDFYTFSSHKLYGPTGCGVLYVKSEHFEKMQPYNLGGGIVEKVDFEKSLFQPGAEKFKAGTSNIAAMVGLVESIDFLEEIGWHDIQAYLQNLANFLHHELSELPFYKPVLPSMFVDGAPQNLPWLASFNLTDIHSHDVASLLDSDNVAIRAGHHCAQPLHKVLSCKTSIRASLGIYNDFSDIEQLVKSLKYAYKVMNMS